MVHYRGGNASIDSAVYPEIEQFWADLAAAYAKQIQGVYDLGCRFLQLDDTSLAYINDPAQREHITAIGGDPSHLPQYISVINAFWLAIPVISGLEPTCAVGTISRCGR